MSKDDRCLVSNTGAAIRPFFVSVSRLQLGTTATSAGYVDVAVRGPQSTVGSVSISAVPAPQQNSMKGGADHEGLRFFVDKIAVDGLLSVVQWSSTHRANDPFDCTAVIPFLLKWSSVVYGTELRVGAPYPREPLYFPPSTIELFLVDDNSTSDESLVLVGYGLFQEAAITAKDETLLSSPIEVAQCIAVGSDCSSASALKFSSLREKSYPFDWVRSSPASVLTFLEHRSLQIHGGSNNVEAHSLFEVPHSVSVSHKEGTNRYYTINGTTNKSAVRHVDASTTGESHSVQLLFDKRFGVVATEEEASAAARRSARFDEFLQRGRGECSLSVAHGKLLVLLHIGQSCHGGETMYCTVNDEPLLSPRWTTLPTEARSDVAECGAGEAGLSNELHTLVAIGRLLMQGGTFAAAIVVAVNVMPVSFHYLATTGLGGVIKDCAPILVHQVCVGNGEGWRNTAAVCSDLLNSLRLTLNPKEH